MFRLSATRCTASALTNVNMGVVLLACRASGCTCSSLRSSSKSTQPPIATCPTHLWDDRPQCRRWTTFSRSSTATRRLLLHHPHHRTPRLLKRTTTRPMTMSLRNSFQPMHHTGPRGRQHHHHPRSTSISYRPGSTRSASRISTETSSSGVSSRSNTRKPLSRTALNPRHLLLLLVWNA